MNNLEPRQITIQPIISYPREAEVGKAYLLTVDIQTMTEGHWPYPQEDYALYCILDTSPIFNWQALGESIIVLNRFGGTYGPAAFSLTASEASEETSIEVKLINESGILIQSFAIEKIKLTPRRKMVQEVFDTPKPLYTPPPLSGPDTLADPGPLPPTSYMPYGRNPLFTGRERELKHLARAFLHSGNNHIVIATTGIGGVGKSQLAIEFVHRYGRFFAGGVFWVSFAMEQERGSGEAEEQRSGEKSPDLSISQSPFSILQSEMLSRIAVAGGGMDLQPLYQEVPVEEQVRLVQAAWEQPVARLLIFDNCEDERLLQAWRPKRGGARLLVTARRSQWDAELGVQSLRLGVLDRVESVRLLQGYLKGDQRAADEAGLSAIAGELGDLPLALRLAGSYLARYRRETLAGYLAQLQQPTLLQHPSLQGAWLEVSVTSHEQHVGRTFATSFDRLQPEHDEADRLAVALLARAACFAAGEPLPAALLLTTVEAADSVRPSDDGLSRLLELSLLEPSGENDEMLRLHRLLAAFTREVAPDEEAQSAVEQATSKLAYQQNEAGYPAALRTWDTHLRHVTETALGREDEQAATLAANLGYYLQMSGDLAGAHPYYERALAIRERVLGRDHPDTATSLNNLGSLLRAMGDLAGARSYYEEALAIREHVLNREHPDTATSLNNLGSLLRAMGDLAGARSYYEQAQAILEHVLGRDHPYTATSLNNLGSLLHAMGDLAEAWPYYERALTIYERVLGPDHPDTSLSLNNLGSLLQEMGDLAGARSYYERALIIREKTLGPDHPDTAQSLNNLGGLLQAMGDYAGARLYYERTLAIQEKVLGTNHPDTATSLNNLGLLLKDMGDIAISQAYLERALKIFATTLGPNHPNTQMIRNNYGIISRSGAIVQGEGATAVGERGVNIAGNISGSVITSDSNVIIQTSRDVPAATQKEPNFSIVDYGWAFVRNISPTDAQLAEAYRIVDELRDKLSNIRTILEVYLEIIMFGSVARGTAIAPIADVDVLVMLKVNPQREKPRVAYEIVQHILRQVYNRNLIENTREVRQFRSFGASTIVEVQNRMRLEVTPAVKSPDASGQILIPDWRVQKWVPSYHQQHAEFVDKFDRQTNGLFRPLVKMVKHWQTYPRRRKLFHSFVVECLVAANLNFENQDLLEAFQLLLKRFRNQYDTPQKLRRVPVLGVRGETKITRITHQRHADFMRLINETLEHIDLIQEAQTLDGQVREWRKIFGNQFPERLPER